jgi:hypothetical protein
MRAEADIRASNTRVGTTAVIKQTSQMKNNFHSNGSPVNENVFQ